MALTVGRDRGGDWASLECDAPGCDVHVSGRPAEPMTGYDLACCVVEMAVDLGWALRGGSYCPDHRIDRPGRRLTVGDGFPWVRVAHGGSQAN